MTVITKNRKIVIFIASLSITAIIIFMILNPFIGNTSQPTTPNVTYPGYTNIPSNQTTLYNPLQYLADLSEDKVLVRLYGDRILELPLIDASKEPYQKYLNLLMSYIPSLEYNYTVTYIDRDGNVEFLGGVSASGYESYLRFELEAIEIYRLGYGIEMIISEVDNLENKVIVIHNRIYDLSDWISLLSLVRGRNVVSGVVIDPDFLGWAIWMFNLRVNKDIYVDGEVATLTNILLILEQPIYNSMINYWNIETEILFWSIVARPAFSLAFNIAIEDFLELRLLYKNYALYFSRGFNVVMPQDKPIDGLFGCATPLRLVNMGDVNDCRVRALAQSIFLTYALGYPVGVIDDIDSFRPSYPGSVLIIPSLISQDVGNPLFTIDLNGDRIPERYIDIVEIRYSLEDIGRTRQYTKFLIYLLNPDTPTYPYEGLFKYASEIEFTGLKKYFDGLPKMFKPPWAPAVETLYIDDPMYRTDFTIYGYEYAEAKLIGPILKSRYLIYNISRELFFDIPDQYIYAMLTERSADSPTSSIVKELYKVSNIEPTCKTSCRVDEWIGENIDEGIGENKIKVFRDEMIEAEWDILWKVRHFNQTGFTGYTYSLIFQGIYEGTNLKVFYDLRLEYPNLTVNIKIQYSEEDSIDDNTSTLTMFITYGIPPYPVGNESPVNPQFHQAFSLSTIFVLEKDRPEEIVIFPSKETFTIPHLSPENGTIKLKTIHYTAIYDLSKEPIEETEIFTYKMILITAFYYQNHETAIFIKFNNIEE